jgi:hypothetical protein
MNSEHAMEKGGRDEEVL